MATTSIQVVTLAKACELLQSTPSTVRAAALLAGVEAVLTINDRPHYRESDVDRIREALRGPTHTARGV